MPVEWLCVDNGASIKASLGATATVVTLAYMYLWRWQTGVLSLFLHVHYRHDRYVNKIKGN